MNILSILVSTAITFIIVFIFRNLDRDSNTLAKVRKYADSRLAEFNTYFAERSRGLTSTGADLDTKQTQAVAAVKRLEKQLDDFHQMIATMDGSINTVNQLEDKIKSYSALLTNLTEMTANVEENLVRVRKESGIVDQLNKRLDSQTRSVADIEKRVPEITAKFTRINADQLKAVGTELLTQYEKRLQGFTAATDASVHRNEELQAKIEQDIASAYSSAAEKANRLESAALSSLRRQIDENAVQIKQIADQVAEQADGLTRQVSDVQDKYTRMYDEAISAADAKESAAMERYNEIARQHSEAYKAAVEEKMRAIQDTLKNTIAEMQSQITAAEESAAKSIEQLTASYTDVSSKAEADSAERLRVMQDSVKASVEHMQEQISAAQNSADEAVSRLTELYTEASAKAETASNEQLLAVQAAVNDSVGKIQEQIAAAEAGAGQAVARLSDLYEAASSKSDELSTKHLKEVQDAVDAATAKMQEQLTAAEKYTDDAVARLTDVCNETTARTEEASAQRLEEVQASIKTTLETMQAEITAAEKSANDAVAHLTQVCDEASARAETSSADLTAKTAAVNERIESFSREIHEKVDAIDALVAGFQQRVNAACDTRESAVLEQLDSQLTSYKKDIEYRLSQLASVGGDADVLEQTLRDMMAHAQDAVKADFDTFCMDQKSRQSAFEQSIRTESEALSGQLAELERSMDSMKDSAMGSMGAKIRDVENRFSADLADHGNKVKQDLAEWKQAFADKLNDLMGEYETEKLKIEEAQNGVKMDFEKFCADQQDREQEFAATVHADADRLNGRLADIERDMDELKEAALGSISAKLQGFEAQFDANLQAHGDKVNEELEVWKRDFASKLASINEAYAAERQRIEQQKDDIKRDFDSFCEEQQARHNDFSASIKKDSDEIAGQLAILERNMEELKNTALGNMSVKLKGFEDKFDADLVQHGTRIDEDIIAWKQSFAVKLSELTREYEAEKENIRQSQQAVRDAFDRFAENQNQRQQEFADSIRQKSDDISGELAVVQGNIDELKETALGNMRTTLKGFEDKFTEDLRQHNDALASDIAEWKQGFSDRLEALNGEYEAKKQDFAAKCADLDGEYAAWKQRCDQAAEEVRGKFETFSREQRQVQADFAETIKQNSGALEEHLAKLEKDMEALKESAMVSLSSKLQGVQDTFTAELQSHGNKLNDELAQWKQEFAAKFHAFTDEYEGVRRETESRYTEDMKEKLAALQKKSGEQMELFNTNLEESKRSIQLQLDEANRRLQEFVDHYRGALQQATDSSDALLRKSTDSYAQRITEQLSKTQKELTDNLVAFEDSMTARQQTSASTIDAALAEFTAWKQQLKQQLDESKAVFTEQLESLKLSAGKNIEDTRATLNDQVSAYSVSARDQIASLTERIAGLNGQTEASVNQYEAKSRQIIEELQKMYDDMLRQTRQQISDQTGTTKSQIDQLRKDIESATNDNMSRQANMVLKMQNDANEIQSRMSELDKEVKAVAAQMQMYDKADQMKKQLDDKVSVLLDDFSKLDSYREAADKMAAEYGDLQRLDSEMNDKLAKFQAKKAQIDSMEQHFSSLMTLSSSMNDKIKDLQTTSDDLQELQIAVKNFQETLAGISMRYDRLEKKNEVIDRVAADVDRSFDNMRQLEERLSACLRQSDSLPMEIAGIQRSVDTLLGNGDRIDQAVAKLESLQDILKDADARVDAIKSERDGIGRSEARLQQMEKEIDEKMNLLARISRPDERPAGGRAAGAAGSIVPQDREHVKRLKRQGWDIAAIAKALKRSESEIELLLELPD